MDKEKPINWYQLEEKQIGSKYRCECIIFGIPCVEIFSASHLPNIQMQIIEYWMGNWYDIEAWKLGSFPLNESHGASKRKCANNIALLDKLEWTSYLSGSNTFMSGIYHNY